jgi:hypothetical protein
MIDYHHKSRAKMQVTIHTIDTSHKLIGVNSGLRPHEASEERESYYLSDEILDFT